MKLQEDSVVVRSDVLIDEVNIDFHMLPVDLKFCTIKEVIFQKRIYDRISLIAMIQDISVAEERTTLNGALNICKAVAVHNDDEISITFFGKTGDDLVESSSYKITYLTINVFNNERIVKTENVLKLC